MTNTDNGNAVGTGDQGNGPVPGTLASASTSGSENLIEGVAQAEHDSGTPIEQRFTHIHVLGHAGWLLSRAPEYRHLFVNDLEWLVMPPVALNQFRLWRSGNVPQAFATWAYLGAAQVTRLEAGVRRLSPGDWKSGPEPWVIDVIAPFGGREAVIEQLREEMFENKPFRVAAAPDDGNW